MWIQTLRRWTRLSMGVNSEACQLTMAGAEGMPAQRQAVWALTLVRSTMADDARKPGQLHLPKKPDGWHHFF